MTKLDSATLTRLVQAIDKLTDVLEGKQQIEDATSSATVKSPEPTGDRWSLEMVGPAPLTPTAGNAGSEPDKPFVSASKLLVKGQGELSEILTLPTVRATIVPPYAAPSAYNSVNSPLPFETIIRRDDRVRILDTGNSPWRMICSLSIQGPRGEFVGTGWFAGPKTIITAGHCLYEKDSLGGWATRIEVVPGRDGNEFPYESVVSTRFEVPDKWLKGDPDYDYGVIYLDRPIGDQTGWFSVAVADDSRLNGSFVNLSGYPGDAAGGFGIYQLFHKDRVANFAERRLFYEIDTFGGQSGSPVWFERDNGDRQVVGIHTYGIGNSFRLNSATRITPAILNDIKRWLNNP